MRPTEEKDGRRAGTVVGIAGMMGAGKSTVASVFESLGAARIDADDLGKALLEREALKRSIVEAFGDGVLGGDGRVDAAALGRAAFADEASAARLNRITRGPLVAEIKGEAERLRRSNAIVVIDAALLPEWGAHEWVDVLIIVDSEPEACVRRLVAASRFDEDTVRARMARQMSREEKKRHADIVILNDGTQEELIEKARQAYEAVVRRGGRAS